LAGEDSAKYGAIISFVDGKMKPLKFEDMIDPKTQRMKPRKVNVDSESFQCAKRYMVRLEPGDLTDADRLAALAGLTNLGPEQFKERFAPAANL
jgi:6-phosphofructokinase 1